MEGPDSAGQQGYGTASVDRNNTASETKKERLAAFDGGSTRRQRNDGFAEHLDERDSTDGEGGKQIHRS